MLGQRTLTKTFSLAHGSPGPNTTHNLCAVLDLFSTCLVQRKQQRVHEKPLWAQTFNFLMYKGVSSYHQCYLESNSDQMVYKNLVPTEGFHFCPILMKIKP